MQTSEKRKNPRRSITYPAFIDMGDGAQPRECTLRDASQEGAQLDVAEPNTVPNEFILALSFDGAARRRCRVIWRTENQVGVEFLKDNRKSQKLSWRTAALRPTSSAPVAAPKQAPGATVDVETLSHD